MTQSANLGTTQYFTAPDDGTPKNVKLYNAALEAFLQEGDESVSVAVIAARAGVSESHVHKNLNGKRGLQRAVFARCWGHIDRELRRQFTSDQAIISVKEGGPYSGIYWALVALLQICDPGQGSATEKAQYAIWRCRRKEKIGLKPAENPEFPEDTNPRVSELRSIYDMLISLSEAALHFDDGWLKGKGWTSHQLAGSLMEFVQETTMSRLTGGQVVRDMLNDERLIELFEERLGLGPGPQSGGNSPREAMASP